MVLSCCFPEVPAEARDDLSANGRKSLWACDAPSDAADVLRSIGLHRLANTTISSHLTGHALARLIDNIPAQRFLGEHDEKSTNSRSSVAWPQTVGVPQDASTAIALTEEGGHVHTLSLVHTPLPHAGNGGALAHSPQTYAASNIPGPEGTHVRTDVLGSLIDSSEDDCYVDIIPSAREPFEGHIECEDSFSKVSASHPAPTSEDAEDPGDTNARWIGADQDGLRDRGECSNDQKGAHLISVPVNHMRDWWNFKNFSSSRRSEEKRSPLNSLSNSASSQEVNGRMFEQERALRSRLKGDDTDSQHNVTHHLQANKRHGLLFRSSPTSTISPPSVPSRRRPDQSKRASASASLGLPQSIEVATAAHLLPLKPYSVNGSQISTWDGVRSENRQKVKPFNVSTELVDDQRQERNHHEPGKLANSPSQASRRAMQGEQALNAGLVPQKSSQAVSVPQAPCSQHDDKELPVLKSSTSSKIAPSRNQPVVKVVPTPPQKMTHVAVGTQETSITDQLSARVVDTPPLNQTFVPAEMQQTSVSEATQQLLKAVEAMGSEMLSRPQRTNDSMIPEMIARPRGTDVSTESLANKTSEDTRKSQTLFSSARPSSFFQDARRRFSIMGMSGNVERLTTTHESSPFKIPPPRPKYGDASVELSTYYATDTLNDLGRARSPSDESSAPSVTTSSVSASLGCVHLPTMPLCFCCAYYTVHKVM